MTFIMQMHTNQNQPSENRSWEKPQRIKLNEGGEWRGAVFGWGGYKSKTERGGESGESTVRSTKNRQYKLLH